MRMSKRATPLKKPEIILDQNVPAPLYRQLYERLRGSILAGQLETGVRLPGRAANRSTNARTGSTGAIITGHRPGRDSHPLFGKKRPELRA